MEGWMDRCMTFIDVCFSVPIAPVYPHCLLPLCISVLPPYHLYICLSFSLFASLNFPPFMSPSFSSPGSYPLPLSFALLWSIIHIPLWLFLSSPWHLKSLRPLQGVQTPTNSASLLGKEIEWWIKEQSEETDKKLWDEQLYRYVKVFLHVVYCTGWHFTQSCVIQQKHWILSTVWTAYWKVEAENITFLHTWDRYLRRLWSSTSYFANRCCSLTATLTAITL